MLISDSLPFIRDYVEGLNTAIKSRDPEKCLSAMQRFWLSFVILGLLVTNSLCWQRYERFSLGKYKTAQMSWFFRKAKIFWDLLLWASVCCIVSVYRIKEGVLVTDDTDKQRSKNTTKIGMVHKIKDKKTAGYFNGQSMVFILLVCEHITIPVGFRFYEPDPSFTAWKKEDARLKKKKVEKQYRPKQPEDDPKYPSKSQIALDLMEEFVEQFPDIRIKGVVGDTVYGSLEFMEKAAALTKQMQVVSKIKKNQFVIVNNKPIKVEDLFKNYLGHEEEVVIRGQKKTVVYSCIKCKVKSHHKKYFVIALRQNKKEEYRYLIARDMSWRCIDIIKTFAFRWLVEVFFQDWKQYEGWGKLTKQTGVSGSTRGVTVSLLLDHALLLHQDQKALFENKEPLVTVGSIREKVMAESLGRFINDIVSNDDPKALFQEYIEKICSAFKLRPSQKHMTQAETSFLNEMVTT